MEIKEEKGNHEIDVMSELDELDDLLNSIADDKVDSSVLNNELALSNDVEKLENSEVTVPKVEDNFIDNDLGESSDFDDDMLELVQRIEDEYKNKSMCENELKLTNNLANEVSLDLKMPEKIEDTEKDASSSNVSPEKGCETEEILAGSPSGSELTLKQRTVDMVDTDETAHEPSDPKDLFEINCDNNEKPPNTSSQPTPEEVTDESLELNRENAVEEAENDKAELKKEVTALTDHLPTAVFIGKDEEAMDVDFDAGTALVVKREKEVTPIKSANEEASTSAAARLTETPEDLINILKMLSPEKLEVIKSQLFNTSKEEAKNDNQSAATNELKNIDEKAEDEAAKNICTKELVEQMDTLEFEGPIEKTEELKSIKKENDEKMEVDDNESLKTAENDETLTKIVVEPVSKAMITDDNDDDCVILLDTDDENENAATNQKLSKKPSEVHQSQLDSTSGVLDVSPQNHPLPQKSVDENQREPEKVTSSKHRECVNNDCARESREFLECPQFVINFFGVTRKLHKAQYVCANCNDKAIIKFEEMGEAFLNNHPIFKIKVPKKSEMVEVIDSDDEDERTEPRFVPTSQKIVWNEKVELEVENILNGLCETIDFKKQLQFGHDDIQTRSTLLALEQAQFDSSLKKLEQMSNRMYNDLYSINMQKIEHRPSIEITHNFDPPKQPSTSLKEHLTSKSQPLQAKIASNSRVPDPPIPSNRPLNPVVTNFQLSTSTSPAASKPPIVNQPSKIKCVMMPQKIAPKPSTPNEQLHYAVRSGAEGRMQNWVVCQILETLIKDNEKVYRVQFYDNLPNSFAIVKGKDISVNFSNPKLKIGARVIAQFSKPHPKNKDAPKKFIPGVIGEKLSKHNNQRYLVFCDYGQVLYASPHSVREIMKCSENVWEDVHENLRQFIFGYLQSQTIRQRALLNVRRAQVVKTERNGEWKEATVVDIDCSIVKMHFGADQSYEWLYRGSKRLEPLFHQANRSLNTNARRNDPNISYITIDDDPDQQVAEAELEQKKNTARKSTAPPGPHMRILQLHQEQFQAQQPQAGPSQPGAPIILNDDKIYIDDPIIITKHRHFTPRAGISAKKYVAHRCSPSCLVNQAGTLSIYSPLTKPLLTCWERQIVRHKQARYVQYKAPCGRVLRNMYEIHKYLQMTGSSLNVDNFDLDMEIQVLTAYDVIDKDRCPLFIPDMSNGKEGMKIPIINAFDDRKPPELEYSAARIPMKGVHINTDPAFRACCDCTDDCADKSKCACFQLTIQGMKFAFPNEDLQDDDVSFVWKRLLNPVQTGIYECGSHCPCSSRCLNKVVQQPIQVKMQLYRTKDRGWGLECCHDIPKGTFICIYAGKLYREEDANALCLGLNHGDEYFAELDLIETASALKKGFESGVVYEDSDSDEEEKGSDSDSDYDERKANEEDEDFVGRQKSFGDRGRGILTRSTRGENLKKDNSTEIGNNQSSDSDSDGEMVSIMPKAGDNSETEPKIQRNLRKLYGKNERVYIMDAKECGNVGRYFNHCCDPNLMVQSVFVDTHDLRFPWIAFFASRVIKAGEELTWNYNYEVGSVPSKVLYCKCRAKNCRGRIL